MVGRKRHGSHQWGGASGVFDGWTDLRTIGGASQRRLRAALSQCHIRAIRLHPRYGFQGGAGRAGGRRRFTHTGIGPALKARLTELGPWSMASSGFRRDGCRAKKTAHAAPDAGRRCVGHPLLHSNADGAINELAIHRDMNVTAAELLDAAARSTSSRVRLGRVRRADQSRDGDGPHGGIRKRRC